ncbi:MULTISPECIES: poly-gamma-glutamate hydrolase family protein [Thermoactinomyces]|jgi:phage replication-related protein YjqB (UPF0714/DUF867 family)|uniref:Poly-gamma-glutamate hydrolase family protein n=1 Tax=Thermoactinomyces daqus TaxID=1329516 RepID=A0A7W1XB14_9BACL|nr:MULTISPECIES: poly-gamma-glutamate hydrolase family protein [Thermoactinomyces]MBA4543292.1 poly-gamma-glutamate hydrolase family protein [Thermoactinomyces daqus]MBH8598432.1 poly-gamma-glutamate hydrolase family protein [Thermoactinomyces sp. CICC 10523]MBH8604724.1 poly-gamma-glutamate hydrolase family protein [Thermoactinomyces sp. CICC 10522]MBH8606816.1 poly-gamma-glutamate hydrolase family protein [Thermoactinomyces sp. CICC 10521]
MKKFILPLLSSLAVFWPSVPQALAATDIYANYAELSSHYKQGTDYTIETQSKPNDVLILAIHGGRIEKGTDQLAKAIAQDDYSYYIFKANIYKDTNNDDRNDLHLTASHYDEPTALQMTAQKNRIVSLHGAKGTEKIVYMGGLNQNLMSNLSERLTAAGFRVENAPDNLNGNHPENIANKNRILQGAQMELTTAQRDELLNDSAKMQKFADAVRAAISASSSHPDGRTYEFGSDNFSNSIWLNGGNPFYLTGDDYLKGVQSPIDPSQKEKIRFDFYDQNGKLVLSHSAEAVGHKRFSYSTGLPTGYYKIKIVNVSGHPSWIYGGLVY